MATVGGSFSRVAKPLEEPIDLLGDGSSASGRFVAKTGGKGRSGTSRHPN